MGKDYYKILDVPKDADEAALKKVWRCAQHPSSTLVLGTKV